MLSRLVGSFRSRVGTSSSGRGNRRKIPPKHEDDIDNIDNDDVDTVSSTSDDFVTPDRHAYCRPQFLQLTKDEEASSAHHQTRPVIGPKDAARVPLGAGYAECINGGKSPRNEDEAAAASFVLPHQPNGYADSSKKMDAIDVQYFAIFDGHAGSGAALMAAEQLINHLQEKLVEIQDDLFSLRVRETLTSVKESSGASSVISIDCLVRGALEAAFVSFDEQIARERKSYNITGGCAAIVAIIMLDRVYVAHAGDCRAVAYLGNETIELATEFTPETDAKRIQYLAQINPSLTHHVFSYNYFLKPLGRKDIGKKVLCRMPERSGWHYKEITEEDVLLPPLVAGQGKWARLMGMMGVTRGFGDHGLIIPGTKIQIKPFLTAVPKVRILNLADRTLLEDDVLVMGCDGMWDMLRNEQVGSALKASLAKSREEKCPDRYIRAAKDLVLLARGENSGKGWKMKDGQDASFDDISVFVIPLSQCVNNSVRKSL